MDLLDRKGPSLTNAQRRAIKPKGWVKVVAKVSRKGKPATEAFWIRVSRVDGDRIHGKIDNDLVFLSSMKVGDKVVVTMANVVGILAPE